MKVDFKGGKALEKALRELDISQARKKGIARRALTHAAEPIHNEWVRGVDVQRGDLKRSIKIGNRAQTRATRRFNRGAGKDIVQRFIGIDASENERLPIYAHIEEFGSESEPANPAGRRAWESKKMESFNRIADDLGEEIMKVAKRVAR